MAKGIEGHTVSLTKNGYFKLIQLIDKYSSSEILSHVDEISLDKTQARKMLAGDRSEILPTVWDQVKQFDSEAREALLLFSIIFSHKDLITAFKSSTTSEMAGKIKRSDLDTKTYTNLAYALNQANLAVNFSEGATETKYDLSKLFLKNEIGPLAKIILECQLKNMGWSEPTASEPFQRTFEEQIKFYEFEKVLGVSFDQFIDWLNGKDIVKNSVLHLAKPEENFSSQAFIASINKVNLKYSSQLIHRFIASILTKPFVILTGLSGSGKTKLAQAFVQWICQEESQYQIVPVGADWTNREPLLGYPNALNTSEYIKPDTGALDLIIRANSNPDFPYFLILDEMNLSHVERYFADFLSVMESNGEIQLYPEDFSDKTVPAKLKIPNNLFVLGTVNIDETTNMFSPKVLDRANTIEFRILDTEMEDFLNNIGEINLNNLKSSGCGMGKNFIEIAQTKSFKSDVDKNKTLIQFFKELKKTGTEFGYRTATEILQLIGQLTILDDTLSENEKLDIAIMQKLLPKLHGSRRKLCPVLSTLASFCLKAETKIEKEIFDNDQFNFNDPNVLYPLSLEKIARMHKGAIDNGFASFAEA